MTCTRVRRSLVGWLSWRRRLAAGSPFSGHSVAEPSVLHLQQLMREVYSNPAAAAAMGRKGRDTMVQQFSTQRLGKVLKFHAQRVAYQLSNRVDDSVLSLRRVGYAPVLEPMSS
jgi:hypothetical protein